MPVESDDDRLDILSDFGVNAEVRGKTIVGILDNQYEDSNGIAVQVPVFTVRMIDINGVLRKDGIHIEKVDYTVEEIQDDGQGIGHIILQKV